MNDKIKQYINDFRNNDYIPLAYSLLWISGLFLSLAIKNLTLVTARGPEFQTAFKFGIVFIIFLLEIGLGFIDIGNSHKQKQFSSKVFKTTGYIFVDIAITIVLIAFYIGMKDQVFLIYFLLEKPHAFDPRGHSGADPVKTFSFYP